MTSSWYSRDEFIPIRVDGDLICHDAYVMSLLWNPISTTYPISLQWRHNGRDSVSNHQPHDCLLNRLFRRRSKKTPKLCVTGLFGGNSPGTGEFPAQMASNAENVPIWWRHHVSLISQQFEEPHTEYALVCDECAARLKWSSSISLAPPTRIYGHAKKRFLAVISDMALTMPLNSLDTV